MMTSILESIKLYSKTNQFKFSLYDDNFKADTESLYFEIIRENGENLGICSAITFSQTNDTFHILNWAISCRYFELGLEEFILLNIHKMTNSNNIFINYQQTEHNQKVCEMLEKYSDAFKKNENEDTVEIIFTREIINTFNKSTNLSIL
jgi:predicted enzyme involved in methoxymalonyl-ACP biosynthesis